jgi:two-component system, NarL family, response regulator NreC
MASEKIKVLIADDHQIVRDGLRALLEKEADMEVVGQAEDGRTALRMLRDLAPQVVVMDVAMPDLNGIEATIQIKKDFPEVKVIALSMHDDQRFVLSMIKAGASGYLVKDCAFKELTQAIRLVVVKNKIYLTPGITNIVVEKYLSGNSAKEHTVFSVLSPREREVLQLIAEGKTSNQIAEHLHVSIKTVETHRTTILNKLNIRSVAELTKFAIREGITSV